MQAWLRHVFIKTKVARPLQGPCKDPTDNSLGDLAVYI
jgi:hypothetical protein